MHIIFMLYALALFLFVFKAWNKLPKISFIIPMFVGICSSASASAFAHKDHKMLWVGNLTAFLPILAAAAIWWLTRKSSHQIRIQ